MLSLQTTQGTRTPYTPRTKRCLTFILGMTLDQFALETLQGTSHGLLAIDVISLAFQEFFKLTTSWSTVYRAIGSAQCFCFWNRIEELFKILKNTQFIKFISRFSKQRWFFNHPDPDLINFKSHALLLTRDAFTFRKLPETRSTLVAAKSLVVKAKTWALPTISITLQFFWA